MKKTAFFLAMMMAGSVFAGSISRGGASFSRPASPSPARSIGAVRPSVKPAPATAPAAARPAYSSSPATTARPSSAPSPSYAAAPAAPAPAPAPAPAAAPSHAGTFASSFGGSFLGSMLGNSLAGNHGASNVTVNNGGGAPAATPAAAGGAAPAASYVSAPAPGPSLFDQLLSLLGWVAVLAGLAALTWLLVKVIKEWRAERSPRRQYATANGGGFSPVERFLAIQTAFAGKDVPTLTSLLGPDLVGQMLADLPETPTQHQLANIACQVLEQSEDVISIHYTADDKMDNTKLDEVWHYENVRGLWLLNGINAFADA